MKFYHPRIKEIYPVYKLHKNLFRIGLQIGITTEIKDDNNKMWNLVNILDGRPFQDILNIMLTKYDDLTEEDITGALELLDNEGVLEEAGEIQDIKERYHSNIYYFSRYLNNFQDSIATQKKIHQSTILLLGLGGGGSNILTLLAGLGPKKIKIVDFDIVEQSNLGRQFLYKENDIGLSKVQIAHREVTKMNSDIEVETHNIRITSVSDLIPLLDDVDITICVIDEPQYDIQRIVNKAIVTKNIPCIFGASQVSRGRVYSVIPYQTGCFDCLNIHYTKIDTLFLEQFHGVRTITKTIPTIAYGPAIFQLTSAIVDETIRLLTQYTEPISLNRQYEINYENGASFTHDSWGRYLDECPTCGTGKEDDWEIFSKYGELKL